MRSGNRLNLIHQSRLMNYVDFPITAFLNIGFTHHAAILTGVKTVEARKFYIQLCYDQKLSVDELQKRIAEDVFHNQGQMPNNFVATIPEYKQAFRAIRMFKDEYLLDFINVEQLGERDEDIDERVIENEIVHNIKNFIMTFGTPTPTTSAAATSRETILKSLPSRRPTASPSS